MFSSLTSFLDRFKKKKAVHLVVDQNGDLVSDDVVISILVLMIEMSVADDEIDEEETNTVIGLVESALGVPPDVLVELIEEALKKREEHGKIDEFVSLINTTYGYEQKVLLLSLIWSVVLADDKVENLERRFAVQMRNRLRISEEDAERAKQMAKEREI